MEKTAKQEKNPERVYRMPFGIVYPQQKKSKMRSFRRFVIWTN